MERMPLQPPPAWAAIACATTAYLWAGAWSPPIHDYCLRTTLPRYRLYLQVPPMPLGDHCPYGHCRLCPQPPLVSASGHAGGCTCVIAANATIAYTVFAHVRLSLCSSVTVIATKMQSDATAAIVPINATQPLSTIE
ncbi:hypothetical protein B296_00056948 [Ensete ventricosum]|uniref:Uncharacterized protein n=1 Tax=Ensete ventricosum TaxID=4639 RepID=A0A426WWX1_ENSVE|nr:hypothetical protein B296_00056948 [Ensete ventricosum]